VEIRTKIASVTPFCLSLLYVYYTYKTISLRNTILFFVSMLFFDMATTAINNYVESKNTGKPLPLPRSAALPVLFAMLAVAAGAGIALSYYTGLVVLVCGMICFAVGIAYTFGPVTISHLPLGEIFSGIFMGFFIPFLTIYINAPVQSLLDYSFHVWILQVSFNLPGLFKLLLLTIPGILCIANVMLANNICDLETDRSMNRFTLPHYIGMKNALRLFAANYYIAYASILLIAAFKVLPVYVLVVFPLLFLVQKNISRFKKIHIKAETFALGVQNLMAVMLPLILVAGAAVFQNV